MSLPKKVLNKFKKEKLIDTDCTIGNRYIGDSLYYTISILNYWMNRYITAQNDRQKQSFLSEIKRCLIFLKQY